MRIGQNTGFLFKHPKKIVSNIFNMPYTIVDNLHLFLNEITYFIDMNCKKHKGIFLAETAILNLQLGIIQI